MLKILSGNQVKGLDSAHCKVEKISSLELMERAALAFVSWWESEDFKKDIPVFVFCGAGNNGGDGFAIARILHQSGFKVSLFRCFDVSDRMSPDALKNLELLPEGIGVKNWDEFDFKSQGILIDSFLGVGFRGDLRPLAKGIIDHINSFQGLVVSVDIPSGLPADELLIGSSVKADFTVTFAFPKLSLLFPEHGKVTGELILVDIGIEDTEYDSFDSPYFFLRKKDIGSFHRRFGRFSHKGDFGKILVLAGSEGKMGAAILSATAALRTGSGLVTALIPSAERQILQIAVPEACSVVSSGISLEKVDLESD